MARYLSAAASLLSVHAVAGKTAPLDSKQAAGLFNDWFTGHGSADGVVLRQTYDWEVWCGEDCFKGRPDCTLSASYANLEIGTNQKTRQYNGVFYFNKMAGIVFNSTLVNAELARCYYSGDGKSWNRYNGGCGCKVSRTDQTCSSPHSPYANVGPDGKVVYGDTPEAERCMCKDDKEAPPKDGCFWRGAAYNTSAGPYGGTEVQEFVHQASLSSDFSEVVLDGHVVKRLLATDPASVILGAFYIRHKVFEKFPAMNEEYNLGVAQRLQRTVKEKYGVEVPIVGLSMDTQTSRDRGPFFEHDASASAVVV